MASRGVNGVLQRWTEVMDWRYRNASRRPPPSSSTSNIPSPPRIRTKTKETRRSQPIIGEGCRRVRWGRWTGGIQSAGWAGALLCSLPNGN